MAYYKQNYASMRMNGQNIQNPSEKYEKQVGQYIFQLNDVIGVGEFSKVYRGKNEKTGQQVAIKAVEVQKISKQIFHTLLQNEITILRSLDHKNLLRLHDILQTQKHYYLITEYCNSGDLGHLIQKNKRLSERKAARILKHLINGLIYLQGEQIIHRDIKPANILVSDGVPKFADFGFAISKQLSKNQKDQLSGFSVGTPLYMAPETLFQNQYTFKSDIWALGCVFYEMLFGSVPFFSQQHKELLQKIKYYERERTLHFPKDDYQVSQEAKELLNQLLNYDPIKRISLSDMIKHSYFKQEKNLKVNVVKDMSASILTPSPLRYSKKKENQSMNRENTEQFDRDTSTEFDHDYDKIHWSQKSHTDEQYVKQKRGVGASQLINFIDKVINDMSQDQYFDELQAYINNNDLTQFSEIRQLDNIKEKLTFMGMKAMYIIYGNFGIIYEREDILKTQLAEFVISQEAMNDQIYQQVFGVSKENEKEFFLIFLEYLQLCLISFDKFLAMKINNKESCQIELFTESINRLNNILQLYDLFNLLLDNFDDFTQFYQKSNLDKISSTQEINIDQGYWETLRTKLRQLN